MPARYWLLAICVGLTIGLAACQTTQTGTPVTVSTSAAAAPTEKLQQHPFDQAIFVGCLPAILATNPLKDFADHLRMNPARPGLAQTLKTRPDQTFTKWIPDGGSRDGLYMGMLSPTQCIVAAPKISNVPALQKSIENFLIGPGSPFTRVLNEDRQISSGDTTNMRFYEGAVAGAQLAVSMAMSPDAVSTLQAVVIVGRRN